MADRLIIFRLMAKHVARAGLHRDLHARAAGCGRCLGHRFTVPTDTITAPSRACR
jgi:hypothetical protein